MSPNPTATFAQLCQTLTEIEETAGIHVFDLYHSIHYDTSYPFAQTGNPWIMPSGDFLTAFYDWGDTKHGNGQFTIPFDCSNTFMELLHWKIKDYPFTTPTGAVTDLSYNSADILNLVPQQWALDLSNNSTDCWTSCSYMNILKELLVSRNLCNFGGCTPGGICCSLNAAELAAILNEQDPSGAVVVAGGVGARTGFSTDVLPGGPVAAGDNVILAVLFKNDNVGARNIEIRLHFQIVDGDAVPPTTPSVWP
jgi:hypothetical protein